MSTSPATHDGQQMMEREREIRLAGAEVDDPQAPRRQGGQDVLDELEKAVDLSELVVALRATFPSRVITPSSTRNGTGTPSGEQPLLARGRARASSAGRLGGRRSTVARLPPASTWPVGVRRVQERLAELASDQMHEAALASRPAQGSRRSCARRVMAPAIAKPPLDDDRVDRDLARTSRVRSGEACSASRPSASPATSRSWTSAATSVSALIRRCDDADQLSARDRLPARHGEPRDDPVAGRQRSRSPSSSPRPRRSPDRRQRRRLPATPTLRTVPCIGLTTAPDSATVPPACSARGDGGRGPPTAVPRVTGARRTSGRRPRPRSSCDRVPAAVRPERALLLSDETTDSVNSSARCASSSDSTSPWQVAPSMKHGCSSKRAWKPSSVGGPSIRNSSSARSMRLRARLAVGVVDDQLGDHRVVETGDLVSRAHARVDAHTGPARLAYAVISPGAGRKPLRDVLCVDAALDRMPAEARRPPAAARAARPAAIRICSRTRSSPVTSSVTVCSTWMRVFISMKK